MQRTAPDVVEDVFEGEKTGVEVEDTGPGEDDAIKRPWNPDEIRVTTRMFSLRNIFDLIDEGSLELAPDFQRGRVWRPSQKSKLVESVLLQIPLPAFYFAEDTDGTLRVVDGLQRLSTLHDFARATGASGFRLKGLEYLELAEDRRFADLSPQWQRRIYNTQLTVNVIDPGTPPGVMYDIFKRINTGGTPLNSQEIRHCMSRQRSRDVLKELTHLESFRVATNGLTDHIRMSDREMALRFAAFRLLGVDAYMEQPGMDAFLMTATRELDDPKRISEAEVRQLVSSFDRAMANTYTVFDAHAFRKWPQGQDGGRGPINRALFETWSCVLADSDPSDLKSRRQAIRDAARKRMSTDYEYLDSITTSTSDRRRVKVRFVVATELAEAGR